MLTGRPGARSPTRGPGTAPATPGPHWRSSFTQGNNLYQNMKIYLEKNLEEERQKLLQEQRACRSRARKYCIESNRRRKAFEEKRKKEEEKEHQIREQILQQRKQKLEEVTEKFQRAHIPPQRRRTVYQKPIPRLEEALEQIQGFNLKQESNFSSSNRPTINWKSLPACPAVSTPSSPDQLSPPLAPMPYHISQTLPTCPILSPIRQLQTMTICPSVSPKLPDSFLPASTPSYQTIYLPHPPTTLTSSFSGCLPHLPAPILSEPPLYLPCPPQRPTISDPIPHNKLFYTSSRPSPFHPTQFSTPSALKPALVRRSLPTRLVVSPVHSEAVLPILMPSCSSSRLPYLPAPVHSYAPGYLSQLPQHPVNPDLVQSVQPSPLQTKMLSCPPQSHTSFVPRPPPCCSPSTSTSSSPSTCISSSSSPVLSSSSVVRSPTPLISPSSSSTAPSILCSAASPFSSPLPSSLSPCLPSSSFIPSSLSVPFSSSYISSSSSMPWPSISIRPSTSISVHPFIPSHWGKKVEKKREEGGVEKKGIEKKILRQQL